MKLPAGYVKGQALAPVKKPSGFGGFGQTMLEKMGWQKGEGLGKHKHGMAEALDVKKKDDALGVGAKESGWKWDWKYWEDAYNGAAKAIDATTTSAGSSSSSSSSSSDDSSSSDSSSSDDSSDDDEPALAALMACAVNHDGTRATGSAEELKLAQQLAKDPWGRFGGRRGKLARIRQQEEQMAAVARAKLAAAQLQVASTSPATAAASAGADLPTVGKEAKHSKRRRDEKQETAPQSAGTEASSKKRRKGGSEAGTASDAAPPTDSDAAGTGANDSSAAKQKKGNKRKGASDASSSGADVGASDSAAGERAGAASTSGRKRIVVQLKGTQAPVLPFVPTPASGWWGAKQFQSAGLLEGLDEAAQHVKRERAAFNEDDQEQLYHKAQDAKRQGKRGLGKSEKLAIAGGNWEGMKTTFQDEADDQSRGTAGMQVQQQADQGQQPSQQQPQQEEEQGEQQGLGSGKKPKWGKLAVAVLREAPGNALKYKKLWRAVWTAQQQRQQGADEEACKAQCWRKLQRCGKLELQGKLVVLKA